MIGIWVFASEVFDDMVSVDEVFELVYRFGEVYFGGYNRVEPAFDYGPYPWGKGSFLVQGPGRWAQGVWWGKTTLKDPGSFMN